MPGRRGGVQIYDGQGDNQHGKDSTVVLPNPFVVSEHWRDTVTMMNDLLNDQHSSCKDGYEWKSTSQDSMHDEENSGVSKQFHYDRHSKAMKEPEPINDRFLPDLYVGWGSAKCTHTIQEIVENRILSVLLNRLACNYTRNDEPPFQVMMDDRQSRPLEKPHQLIEALIETGHSVETCIRTHVTTFGIALCVKNDDGWANISLAYFLQNGYTDKDGRDAYTCLPHSGLNMEIHGGRWIQSASIQHFMSIDGLCGWHSNHTADVPWIVNVDCSPVLRDADALTSVRIAGLQSLVINRVATEYRLPLGGYGLTGVCNDSAGLLEHAIFNKTSIYPLTFNGRFAMHNLREARELQTQLERLPSNVEDFEAIGRVIEAISSLPSDINSLPSEAVDQCHRQLHCQHRDLPFQLMRPKRRSYSFHLEGSQRGVAG